VIHERTESERDASGNGLLLPRAVVLIAVAIFLIGLCALTTEPAPSNGAHVRLTSAQSPPPVERAVTSPR
jgi:hypothetical protein